MSDATAEKINYQQSAGDPDNPDDALINSILETPSQDEESKAPPSTETDQSDGPAPADDDVSDDADEAVDTPDDGEADADDRLDAADDDEEPDDDDLYGDAGEGDTEDDDDEDDDSRTLYTITVDGQPKQVTLDELKRSYSGQEYIQKGMKEAAEQRKAVQQTLQQAQATQQHLQQRLQQIDELEKEFQAVEPDWDQIRRDAPEHFAIVKHEWDQELQKRQKAREQIQQMKQEQTQLAQNAYLGFLEQQKNELLQKVPDLGDPEKASRIKRDMVEVAQQFGMSVEELKQVADHRPMAMLYELTKRIQKEKRLQSKKGRGDKPVKTKTMRPGTKPANPKREKQRKAEQELKRRAQRSGRPEDVADWLIVSS